MRTLSAALLMSLATGVAAQTQAPAQGPQSMLSLLGRPGVARVVREERTSFFRELTQMTKLTPEVADSFDDSIADRVMTVQVASPAPAAAEATLRLRYRLFLSSMTIYLLTTTQKLTFDTAAITRYLEAAAKAGRCGEIPCQSGCAEGKPCDVRCNACAAR